MTEKANNGRVPLCLYLTRGCWGLTEEGIQTADSLLKTTDQKGALLSRKLPRFTQLSELAHLLGKDSETVGLSKADLVQLVRGELTKLEEDADFLYDQDLVEAHIQKRRANHKKTEIPVSSRVEETTTEKFPPKVSVMTVQELETELERQTSSSLLLNKEDLEEILWKSYEQGRRDEKTKISSLIKKHSEILSAVCSIAGEAFSALQNLNDAASCIQNQILGFEEREIGTEALDTKNVEDRPQLAKISEVQDPPQNETLTGKFLRENYAKLFPYLERYLHQKLAKSSEQDEIGDHIQIYLEKAVRRDAWAKEIREKGTIPFSKIAYFCKRSAFSDIRGWGKDGCCKALKGALTETERKKLEENPVPENCAFPHLQYGDNGIQWGGGEDNAGNLFLQDTTGGDLREEVTEEIRQTEVYQRSEEIIRGSVQPDSAKVYIKALWGLASGMTAKEIAEAEGLEANRGMTVVSDLKELLRQAKAKGRFNDLLT